MQLCGPAIQHGFVAQPQGLGYAAACVGGPLGPAAQDVIDIRRGALDGIGDALLHSVPLLVNDGLQGGPEKFVFLEFFSHERIIAHFQPIANL